MNFQIGDLVRYDHRIISNINSSMIYYVEKIIPGKDSTDNPFQIIVVNNGSYQRACNFELITDILRKK
jgi:hypothetical protein